MESVIKFPVREDTLFDMNFILPGGCISCGEATTGIEITDKPVECCYCGKVTMYAFAQLAVMERLELVQ